MNKTEQLPDHFLSSADKGVADEKHLGSCRVKQISDSKSMRSNNMGGGKKEEGNRKLSGQ